MAKQSQRVVGDPLADLQLLGEKEVAAKLGLSQAMLQKMRREGNGPAFVRIGSSVRYPVADLRNWLAALVSKASP